MTSKQLEKLAKIDIETVDKSELVDIANITIDASAPLAERFAQVMEQVKNPFAFRVGEYAVKIEYKEGGISLREAIMEYLTSARAGI